MDTPSDTLHWYVTCPLPMQKHPDYDQVIQQIGTILQSIRPDSANTLIEAKSQYRDGNDWREKWPGIRDTLVNGGLFFTTDPDGWIGKGVHTEITDVLSKGLEVFLVMPNGDFYPITSLAGDAFVEGPDWKMYTFVDTKHLAQGTDVFKR